MEADHQLGELRRVTKFSASASSSVTGAQTQCPQGCCCPVDKLMPLSLSWLLLLGSRPLPVSHTQSLTTFSVPLCPLPCLRLSFLQASLALAPAHAGSEPGQLHKIHRFPSLDQGGILMVFSTEVTFGDALWTGLGGMPTKMPLFRNC